MEKNHNEYLFSTSTEEYTTNDNFNVKLYEYNLEWCCDGSPLKIVNNFDDLVTLLEEWEE